MERKVYEIDSIGLPFCVVFRCEMITESNKRMLVVREALFSSSVYPVLVDNCATWSRQ